jgi:hypothetical protein
MPCPYLAGNLKRLIESLINNHANMTNKTVQISVCHQGPIRMGNRAKRSHLRQPSFFHQKEGALAGDFAGISISVNLVDAICFHDERIFVARAFQAAE